MTLRKIDASYRIMKILKLLAQRPRSMNELCIELELEGHEISYDTISKYFSTLREFGCVITKKNCKFELEALPFFIDLQQNDVEILADFQKLANETCQLKQIKSVRNAFNKILKMTSQECKNYFNRILNQKTSSHLDLKCADSIEKLSCFIEEGNQKIKIVYRAASFIVTPLGIRYSGNKAYLMAFNENKMVNEQFLLDDISQIQNHIQISNRQSFISATVFKIKGRLVKNYHPYEGEEIEYQKDGSAIVINKFEDKNVLKLRLLKYFEACEILSPQKEREEFIKLVDNLIKNYSLIS